MENKKLEVNIKVKFESTDTNVGIEDNIVAWAKNIGGESFAEYELEDYTTDCSEDFYKLVRKLARKIEDRFSMKSSVKIDIVDSQNLKLSVNWALENFDFLRRILASVGEVSQNIYLDDDYEPLVFCKIETIELSKEKEATTQEKVELLKDLGVESFEDFSDALDDWTDSQELSDEDTYIALENAGVDNWGGYDIAVEYAEEDGFAWSKLSDSDKLNYLESAGVDNWSYYSEAISEFKENDLEPTDEEYLDIFESLERKENWKNYKDYLQEIGMEEEESVTKEDHLEKTSGYKVEEIQKEIAQKQAEIAELSKKLTETTIQELNTKLKKFGISGKLVKEKVQLTRENGMLVLTNGELDTILSTLEGTSEIKVPLGLKVNVLSLEGAKISLSFAKTSLVIDFEKQHIEEVIVTRYANKQDLLDAINKKLREAEEELRITDHLNELQEHSNLLRDQITEWKRLLEENDDVAGAPFSPDRSEQFKQAIMLLELWDRT